MNLSCGNCRTIRSFSGDPPKCDVCGWVCDVAPSKSRNEPSDGWEDFREIVSRVFGLAVVLIIFGVVWTYWAMPEKQRLAEEYKVSQDKVFIEPKPHGCDFDDAPLGNKHCHYEKQVDVERACDTPNCKATGVYVSWRKVEE